MESRDRDMNKKVLWVAGLVLLLMGIIGVVYNHVSTNDKPDTTKSFVEDFHEAVTPDSHQSISQ